MKPRHIRLLWIILAGAFLFVDFLPGRPEQGYDSLEHWADQQRYVRSIKSVLVGERPIDMDLGYHGPGFIALAKWGTQVFGSTPEETLIGISLLSLALCIFLSGLILEPSVGEFQKCFRLAGLQICGCLSIYFLCLFWGTGLSRFRMIPWAHNTGAAILLFCVWLWLKRGKIPQWVFAILLGGAFAWLAQVRWIEAVALLTGILAQRVLLALSDIGYLRSPSSWISIKNLRAAALAVASFFSVQSILCWACCVESRLAYVRTTVARDSIVPQMYRIYPWLIPWKWISIFVDPNFLAFPKRYGVAGPFSETTLHLWRSPLLVQFPIFAWFGVALGMLGILLLLRKIRFQRLLQKEEMSIPVITAFAIISAYLSSFCLGGTHLRYGLYREFVTPTFLLFIGLFPGCLPELSKITGAHPI